jgi:PPK2 family polyphosphate:nucleotide phosphotransferase
VVPLALAGTPLMGKLDRLADPYRVESGAKWRLSEIDPDDTGKLAKKQVAPARLAKDIEVLSELQEKLYAQDSWGLLLVFQAMDAAGKDSTIKHVMSGINPQGCDVHSFKAPSVEELDHDFLWRAACRLPERGRIGIFNRSYYEETLVVRVHPEILARQRLPSALIGRDIWKQRFEDINAFERYLSRNGIAIVKFFLHLSKKEQKKRFLKRLEQNEKIWKFSVDDMHERRHWDDYMRAYEETIRATASKHAPWYVVPADNKWFTRLVVASAVVDALEDLDLAYPTVSSSKKKELEAAHQALESEG